MAPADKGLRLFGQRLRSALLPSAASFSDPSSCLPGAPLMSLQAHMILPLSFSEDL